MPHQRQDSEASRQIGDLENSCTPEAAAASSTTSATEGKTEEALVTRQVGRAHQQPVDDNEHDEQQQQQQQQVQQVAFCRPELTIAERNRLLALSQQPQRVDIMAGRISELEGALAASERRIKSLVYSTAPAAAAAAAASKAGNSDDAVALRRSCAERVRQLEEVLVQAEKRASWLQGELKLVSACAGEHIRELEGKLLAAKAERSSRDSDCCSSSGASTESSDGGGGWSSSEREVDKLRETHQALASLRKKFYRAMKERNELKSKCVKVTDELDLRTKHRDKLAQELETVKATTTTGTASVADVTKDATKQRRGGGKEPNKSSSSGGKALLALRRAPKSTLSYTDDCSWRWPAPAAPASRAGN